MKENKEKTVEKTLTPEEKQAAVKKEIISYIRMLAIVVIAVVIITQVIIINARIPSGSMENTIMTGDRVIGTRFTYWNKGPERGDIVLFKYPVDESKLYIKRCIGLPGETVTIKDGKIYINDSTEPLEETYLKEEWVVENDGYVFEIPEDCYLMLGDNRNWSEDARYWARCAVAAGLADTEEDAKEYQYVSIDAIKGKAVFKYFKGFEKLSDEAVY